MEHLVSSATGSSNKYIMILISGHCLVADLHAETRQLAPEKVRDSQCIPQILNLIKDGNTNVQSQAAAVLDRLSKQGSC